MSYRIAGKVIAQLLEELGSVEQGQASHEMQLAEIEEHHEELHRRIADLEEEIEDMSRTLDASGEYADDLMADNSALAETLAHYRRVFGPLPGEDMTDTVITLEPVQEFGEEMFNGEAAPSGWEATFDPNSHEPI